MSGDLRERLRTKVQAWFDSPDDLAGNDEMAGQVADVALAEVQADLAAKDAEIRSPLGLGRVRVGMAGGEEGQVLGQVGFGPLEAPAEEAQ